MAGAQIVVPASAPGRAGAGDRRAGHRSQGRSMEAQRRRLFWPFLGPALLVYGGLVLAPTGFGVYASFTRWRGSGDEMTWIGLQNYLRLPGDEVFVRSFLNTLAITFGCGAAIFVLAFAITVAIRQARARGLLRAVLFVPYIVSPIVVGVALGLLLAPRGAVNSILRALGLAFATRNWLDPSHLFPTIMVGIIWVTTGFYVLLLSSGVDQIPPYFYEEAELAGVSEWQRFRYVTLPLSWDITAVAAVLWVINSIRIFDFIYAFVGSATDPPVQARTLSIQQFLVTTGGHSPAYEMGYGSAIGVFMIVSIGLLVALVRRLMRREAVEF